MLQITQALPLECCNKSSDVQTWDSKLPAQWHLTTTYRLSLYYCLISFKMDLETTHAHLSSQSLSDTPLFLRPLNVHSSLCG